MVSTLAASDSDLPIHDFKQVKSGAGFKASRAWRPSAVQVLPYAKVVAMALARLLELAVEDQYAPHATKQLALGLTLSRSTPLLMTSFMHQSGVTLQQLEDRLLLIASSAALWKKKRPKSKSPPGAATSSTKKCRSRRCQPRGRTISTAGRSFRRYCLPVSGAT